VLSIATLAALHVATSWTDRAKQATTYRIGRVLLAGDAAHIQSPIGGQGLNAGLGDAMNPGWKLAATIRGEAPDGLLDTYDAERHPVGDQVVNWSRAQVEIMSLKPHARPLEGIIRDLIDTRDGVTYFAERVCDSSRTRNTRVGYAPLTGPARACPPVLGERPTNAPQWATRTPCPVAFIGSSRRSRSAAVS
jgi:2-polyprenyl-6-methoxyphenol hydroxylase-like FAD-dependent oxidoreductase